MREWIVAWAGRHQRGEFDALAETYRRRIRRAVELREVVARPRGGGGGGTRGAGGDGNLSDRLRREGEALLAALPPSCRVVALDSRGKTMTSEKFSQLLADWRETWPHPVAFVLGSDLGLDGAVLDRAALRLSFGPMTFPHELARLLLYEQLFRALAIEAGSSYHRADPSP